MINEMGEMHNRITPMDLAVEMQVSPERVGQLFRALRDGKHPHFAGRFNRFAELNPIQVAVLRGEDLTVVDVVDIAEPEPVEVETKEDTTEPMSLEQGRPNVVAPQKVESNWRATLFVWVAFLIVMGHAGFIWYDMARLWATPGKIGGGAVFLFIFGGMILMSDKTERMKEIRENMLWAVTLLESLAIVVHQATFYRSAGEAFVAGLGLGYTWALAAVVCLISIGATIFYQKVIQ